MAACFVVTGSLYPWIRPRLDELIRFYQLQHLTVVPLTSLPGTVWGPTFSPDGSQVAFVWDGGKAATTGGYPSALSVVPSRDLYVKVIGNDKLLRLTQDGGVGTAAWSPDGQSIALWRSKADGCGIFLLSPLGGPERKIASASCSSPSPFSWSPDGRRLAFLDHPANSPSDYILRLFVLSLDSMEKTLVKTDCDAVLTPAFSPGGDYLAWSCANGSRTLTSIDVQRLSDGRITELLHNLDRVSGLAWSRDGRRIVFSSGGDFSGGDLWEVALARPNHPEKLLVGHDASTLAVSRHATGSPSCKTESM